MGVRNSGERYGVISVVSHWLVAAAVIGLFASGLWMVGLGYYDPWYHRAPELHKAVGILAAVVMLGRLVWRWADRKPRPDPGLRPWEIWTSGLVHGLLYLGIFVCAVSGYLIATAKGAPVDLFGLASLPATYQGLPRQEDLAGEVHELVGWALILLAGLHALAALKHHFFDHDATLRRMLGLRPRMAPPHD